MSFKLPPVPNDVLEALETLPEAKLEEIQVRVMALTLEEAVLNPLAFETEKNTQRTLVKLGTEHMELIRQAVVEMAEERGRGG